MATSIPSLWSILYYILLVTKNYYLLIVQSMFRYNLELIGNLGSLGVVMYREKESPMDRIDALEEHVDILTKANKSCEAENAELIATVDSILTDVLPALLGDGTKETNTENTDTK